MKVVRHYHPSCGVLRAEGLIDGEDISQGFRIKNIEETRSYFIKETDHNELINNKHKNVELNYIEHFLLLVSAVIRCNLISSFASVFYT